MSLIKTCSFHNPIGKSMPGEPDPSDATAACPQQGDHVFGDVLGVVENALKKIFGGGAASMARMNAYNVNMSTKWAGIIIVDYGHGLNPPIAARPSDNETDQHAHVFGGVFQAVTMDAMRNYLCRL